MKVFGVKVGKKTRTSLRLPDAALEKISVSMAKGGYGARGRSKWICEAVGMLSESVCYWELIAEEFMDDGGNELIPVTIDEVTNILLTKINAEYLNNYSEEILDTSIILRTGIYHRLIVEGGGDVSV